MVKVLQRYIKHDKLLDDWKVFTKLENKGVITWAMLVGYSDYLEAKDGYISLIKFSYSEEYFNNWVNYWIKRPESKKLYIDSKYLQPF